MNSLNQVFDVDGTLLETWDDNTRTYTDHVLNTSRPYNEEENTSADEKVAYQTRVDNHSILSDRATKALEANLAFINSSPSNTAMVAQVKALSRQVNALIRLVLNELDSTD